MFCRRFRDQVYQTVRELADPNQVALIQEETGIPANLILTTKCGYICNALRTLMNFQNERNHPLEVGLSSFYGYMFDFEGVTQDGRDTGTDHELILIYDQGWWIIDSYLGCRELTCRQIDPDQLLEISRYLRDQFDEELWFWLTGCRSTDHQDALTAQMRVYVTEFDCTRI